MITDSSFSDNSAIVEGGAIKYNLYRPIITNTTFMNNSASYGADIASYAIKVVQTDSTANGIELKNVGSGVLYDEVLALQLVDHDENVMVLSNSSQIIISPSTSEQSMLGIVNKKVTQGAVSFDSLFFVSKPGDQNIEFKITSNAIDSNILQLQYGQPSLQDEISVSFRW